MHRTGRASRSGTSTCWSFTFNARIMTGRVEDSLAAALANAQASLAEPGVLRFDVIHDQADPAHMALAEVCHGADASAAQQAYAALSMRPGVIRLRR